MKSCSALAWIWKSPTMATGLSCTCTDSSTASAIIKQGFKYSTAVSDSCDFSTSSVDWGVWEFRCFLRSLLNRKPFPQTLQWCGRESWWSLWWALMLLLSENPLLQIAHLNGFSPEKIWKKEGKSESIMSSVKWN